MARAEGLGACRTVVLLGLAIAFAAGPAPAQGTKADYERAGNLRQLTVGKVFRDSVRPQWLPGNTLFWYRIRTGTDTHEFVLVDAEKGIRRPAFDHERLTDALVKAGVKGIRADRLSLLAFRRF